MSDVESVDVEVVDSWDVSAGSGEGLAVVVTDDERSSSVLESSVSELALSASELLGESDSVEVLIDSESLHDGNGVLCSGDRVDGVAEDQRELWNVHDSVTSGKDQWGNCSGGDGGRQSVSPLLEVDLSVPSSPDSQRMGHSTVLTHVSVGTLSGSAGSGSSHSWDSSNGSTGSP